MEKKSTSVIHAVAMVLALGSGVGAQSPTHVTYQGRLTDAGGPANGTFTFVFRIFDDPTLGSLLWTETIPGVTVTQGLFTVVLGQLTPLDPTIFNGSPRWLEIEVQGNTLSPRQELSSAPGAIRATVAGSFSGSLAGEVTGTQTATVVSNAVSTNTPNAVVRRDASGNFSAGTITASLNGNATSATNFTGSLAGEVTGSQGATVVSNAVSTNTINAIVRRDGSGNFAAGTITASLNGNATTATTAANFSGSLAGEVTGTQGATVVSNAVSANTANAIVRRDGSGSFAAGTVTLGGNLDLPNTSSGSVGVVTKAGVRFLHNFGTNNTFVGAAAGNTSLTGIQNTGVGRNALVSNTAGGSNAAFGFSALAVNTTGSQNAAFGPFALFSNTTAFANSAFGNAALSSNTAGVNNAAFGSAALLSNTTGNNNSAFGPFALQSNTGTNNSAFGSQALVNLTSGDSNIAIGNSAGSNLTSGSSNIYLDNGGVGSESSTVRIGSSQTSTFIAGIFGQASASGVAVLVNSSGKLGTTLSSRRYKDGIADLAEESDVLMKLRPVVFYYRPEYDETRTRQYGLVAEEVAEVAPQLVVYDATGAPQTVRYHFVNAMLLNEVQSQRRRLEEQRARIEEFEARLASLEARATEGR